jgi:hypothetical protein
MRNDVVWWADVSHQNAARQSSIPGRGQDATGIIEQPPGEMIDRPTDRLVAALADRYRIERQLGPVC